jgi:hypothetical protein
MDLNVAFSDAASEPDPNYIELCARDTVVDKSRLYRIILWHNHTGISQYRLRFGSSLLYKSVFHLNGLTAQLSYEGRSAVEGGK